MSTTEGGRSIQATPGFRLVGMGRLARNPEVVRQESGAYVSFCLVGGPFLPARSSHPAELGVVEVWFVAFSPIADLVLARASKGDELVVSALLETDRLDCRGTANQGHVRFTVDSFEVIAAAG